MEIAAKCSVQKDTTFPVIQGLLLGLAVAYLKNDHQKKNTFSNNLFKISIVILFSILIYDEWMSEISDWGTTSNILLLININFALMVYACANSITLNQGYLGSSFLRFFARLSYSLYLVHYLFIPWTTNISKNMIESHWGASLLFIPVYFGLVISAAYVLHITVEKPFLLLKDKVRS